MAEINRRTGRPVTFGLAQSNSAPELYREILELVDEEAAPTAPSCARRRRRAASACCSGSQHRTFFDGRAVVAGAAGARRSTTASPRCDDDERRAELIARRPTSDTPALDWNGVYVLDGRRDVDYADDPTTSLGAHARAPASRPAEAFVRHLAARAGAGRCSTSRSSTRRMDAVEEMLDHPPSWRSASATPARTSA